MGAGDDALNRTRFNRAEMTLRRNRRAHIRQMYTDALHYHSGRFEDRKVPPEILRQIKNDIRRKIRGENIKTTVYAFSFTFLMVALIVVMVYIV